MKKSITIVGVCILAVFSAIAVLLTLNPTSLIGAAPVTEQNKLAVIYSDTASPKTVTEYIDLVDDGFGGFETAFGANTIRNYVGFSRAGYNQTGWFFDYDGQVYAAGDNFPGGLSKADGQLVLKTVWTPKTYQITFDVNNGTLLATNRVQTINFGEKIDAACILETYSDHNGLTFKGWSTIKGDAAGLVNSDTVYNFTDDITLYGFWIDESSPVAKVTLKLESKMENGSAGPKTFPNEEFYIGDTRTFDPTAAEFVIAGYTFVEFKVASGATYKGAFTHTFSASTTVRVIYKSTAAVKQYTLKFEQRMTTGGFVPTINNGNPNTRTFVRDENWKLTFDLLGNTDVIDIDGYNSVKFSYFTVNGKKISASELTTSNGRANNRLTVMLTADTTVIAYYVTR